MAQVSYDSLFPQCMMELPGVPVPVLANALNNAAINLCKTAQCWREWQDTVLVADTATYTPSTTGIGVSLVAVLHALVDNVEIIPVTVDQLMFESPTLMNSAGTPSVFWIDENGDVRVAATPTTDDAGKVLRLQVVFRPSIGAASCDSRLINEYGETLCNGAKYELMRIPNKAWSNPKMAEFYRDEFRRGIDAARIDQSHDYTTAGISVQRFAFGSR